MTINFEQLMQFKLERGDHSSPSDGLCAMEAVAWLAGETHSDHPMCADYTLSQLIINVNDNVSDENRQKLIKYLPKIMNTAEKDTQYWDNKVRSLDNLVISFLEKELNFNFKDSFDTIVKKLDLKHPDDETEEYKQLLYWVILDIKVPTFYGTTESFIEYLGEYYQDFVLELVDKLLEDEIENPIDISRVEKYQELVHGID